MYLKLLILISLLFAFACSDSKLDTPKPNRPEVEVPEGDGEETPEIPETPVDTVIQTPVDTKIYVASANEFNAITSLKAGDTVVLRNGTYTDAALKINANGTATLPIVVMGETAGKTVLTNASSIKIGGSHVLVSNLWFKEVLFSSGAIIELRIDSKTVANYCRVTNCAISGTNNSETKTKDYKWVSIYGEQNQVDNCSFTNKSNMGTLMVVWLGAGNKGSHKILCNYFSRPLTLLDDNNKELNGQETIRIGDSNTSMQEAQCTIEGNHFYRCNGEIEVISNKSCGNIYRANILEECLGAITLRHGNRCSVEGNFFLGNNISNTAGVRIIGENHTIRNNYFERIRGTGYRTAICLIRGIENSPLSGYYQVKNALVESNTMVDCAVAIHVNYGSDSQAMPVISTTIRNNVISSTSTSNTAVLYITTPTPAQVTWSGNKMHGAKFTGITQEEVAASTTQPTIEAQEPQYTPIKAACGPNWKID